LGISKDICSELSPSLLFNISEKIMGDYMEIEKFVCQKCGKCCNNFTGSEKDLIGKPPYFIDHSLNCMLMWTSPSLRLWEWEVNLFPKKYVNPNMIVYDLNSNRSVIINYSLTINCCPQLKENNLCGIYSRRPIECRVFPCPYGEVDAYDHITPHTSYGLCMAESPFTELHDMLGFKIIDGMYDIPKDLLKDNLFSRYNEAFIYKIAADYLGVAVSNFLSKLIENNKLRPARKGYNLNGLQKKIESCEMITISELMAEYKVIKLEEIFNKIYQELKMKYQDL